MNRTTTTAAATAVAALLVAVGAGGYWLGTRNAPGGTDASAATGSPAAAAASSAPKARKLLHYRNPMGLADTSPTPKKDPMGMDYIPVYEGEDEDASAGSASPQSPAAPGTVRISTEKVQKLGVRTERAALRTLGRTLRAAGRVEPDERRVHVVAPRFEGYVEKLHVAVTGQPVAKGQPLFEVYSPELMSAQREYAIAMQGVQAMKDAGPDAQAGMRQLADASLLRLRNWELSREQIAALAKSGQPQRTITFASPAGGVVTEKKALQGMRFMPGEMLYQVTDLSSVWVIADLPEQDIGLVRPGAKARVSVTAYPGETFEGRIGYVYPTLKAETRSIPVRVELANPRQRLKPAMFAQVELAVGSGGPVLTVPDSAVIDTGTRRLVLVQTAPGRFEPREVVLGGRGDGVVEVTKGVAEGEPVVVAANFLIDAESNLQAVVGAMGAAASGPAAGAAPSPQPSPAGGRGGHTGASAVVGHQATGSVDSIDAQAGTMMLNHAPIASLNWPAMTMEFKASNAAQLSGLKPGQAIEFEFVERKPGEYVVTSIKATGAAGAKPAAAAPPAAPAAPTPHRH